MSSQEAGGDVFYHIIEDISSNEGRRGSKKHMGSPHRGGERNPQSDCEGFPGMMHIEGGLDTEKGLVLPCGVGGYLNDGQRRLRNFLFSSERKGEKEAED